MRRLLKQWGCGSRHRLRGVGRSPELVVMFVASEAAAQDVSSFGRTIASQTKTKKKKKKRSKKADPRKTDTKKEEPKKKGFGLAGISQAVAPEKQSTQVSASGGARGLEPDKDAKGGPIKTLVKVSVSAAELDAFKKGIV